MRTVRITQTLRDWLRDSNRKVPFLMDGTTVTSNFFDWVDHTLHGASKDLFWQSGVTRDNGLLFPAVPAYNAVYRIPKLSGDSNVEISGAPFVKTETSAYYEISMQTQSGSALSTVYIPHGGYYEAESHKYTTHANLWTRTLVSGNQGFSTTSSKFGYWYQFLDVYKSMVNFSNMRIANGSGGIAPDSYSAFKYMPIRPVWK